MSCPILTNQLNNACKHRRSLIALTGTSRKPVEKQTKITNPRHLFSHLLTIS